MMNSRRLVACEHCFKDERLREWIREEGKLRNCPWCGSQKVYVMPLIEIGPFFRDLVDIYEETDDGSGDDIAYLLQDNWDIFSKIIEENPDLMRKMTTAILEAGLDPKDNVNLPDYRGYFRRADAQLTEELEDTIMALLSETDEQVKKPQHIQETNEFLDVLKVALEDLSTIYEEGDIFFRARIHDKRTRSEKYTLVELGAPVPEKTPDGRANRAGEPVLYLATDEITALAEVRAWKGAAIAIAKVKVRRRLRIINLVDFKFPESPFFEEQLIWQLQLSDLFHKLADELSQPIMPHEMKQLYRLSQKLCDLIRGSGYDGVAFPSAMGSGCNVVFFKPENGEPFDVKYVRVKEIDFSFAELTECEDIYEELPFNYLIDEE